MPLAPEERALTAAPELQNDLESLLSELVEIPSYHADLDGCRAVAERVGEALAPLGFETCIELAGPRQVPALRARRPGASGPRFLLLGHTDTVHPPAEGFAGYRPLEGAPERATGPGAADMKGGVVVIVGALRMLHAAGRLDDIDAEVLLVGDEELGSPDSEDLIREVARGATACLCFEGGRPVEGGASTIVSGRRGCGQIDLEADGHAAHAGVDAARGASAVLELASKVEALTALSDPEAGIAVTVGILEGGSSPNTVPAHARMSIDYRFPDQAGQERVEKGIEEILSQRVVRDAEGHPRVALRCTSHSRRAALERTEISGALAERVVLAGADLDVALVEEHRGGSSDAALTPEVGCPAVCGMGIVGDRFHSHEEWVVRASLVERARVTALVLDREWKLASRAQPTV